MNHITIKVTDEQYAAFVDAMDKADFATISATIRELMKQFCIYNHVEWPADIAAWGRPNAPRGKGGKFVKPTP